MAWVSKIVASEQVEYRLSEDSGCYVGEGESRHADGQVDYRMRPEGGGLEWIGSGLSEVGKTPGAVLDEDGREAARAVMRGVHPVTGEQLIEPQLRAHPHAKLPGAPLLDAVRARAENLGVEPAELFAGKPKQQKAFATLARQVHAKGERHQLQVDSLHRLARAAGVRLEDVYESAALASARAHQDERVDVRVRGYDLVADVPKSVSVLWGLLPEEEERELRAIVHEARREAFSKLEEWIAYGVAGERGALERIATGGLLGWAVEHQSARPVDDALAGDPHLHVHLVIANMARCEDGTWRAIANGGRDLFRHASAFDALFKARVRALAEERLGVRFAQDDRTGAWEAVGVPPRLRAHFSRRAAQVDALAGEDASRAEKLKVSAETRHAKHDRGPLDLRGQWRQRAQEQGVDVDAMVAAAAPGPGDGGLTASATSPTGPRVPSPAEVAERVFDPEHGVTSSEKTFTRAQLLAAVAHACPHGLPAEELEPLAEAVLAEGGFAVPVPARGAGVLVNADRYTTRDLLDAEHRIVEETEARIGEGTARLDADAVAMALSVHEATAGYMLSTEQRVAVERILGAGHGVDAIVGAAGSGKTSLLTACRIGWDAAGYTYAGAALSAVAADGLRREAGVPAHTVASWRERIARGPGLAGIGILIIDEAVMVDDRALAELLDEAARTGTKVVAVGDPQQLRAIGPGGGVAEAHRLLGGVVLKENRRQRDAVEREAAAVWREGEAGREAALTRLSQHGHVHAVDRAEDARNGLLDAWEQARAASAWRDPHELSSALMILATRTSDVALLNAGAQRRRRAAGELGAGHTFALSGGDRLYLAQGDVVRLHRNDYRSRRGEGPDVLNGYRAVIEQVTEDHRVRVSWRTPSGTARAWLSPEQIAAGEVSLGYAATIASVQGLTVEQALVYGLGADARSMYPALTRARARTDLWLPTAALEDEETRALLGEPKTDREALHRAVDAYAALLRQERPEGMVLHALHGVPEPVGDIPAWNAGAKRPFGHASHGQVAAALEAGDRPVQAARAAADRARDAADRARRELDAGPGREAARAVSVVLEQATALAALAAREEDARDQAAAEAARHRQTAARVQAASERGRLALRLAGTSRAEQRELRELAEQGEVRSRAEQHRAERAAVEARRDAWQTVRESRYAAVLEGADALAPRSTSELRRRLAHLHAQVPQMAARIDSEQARRAAEADQHAEAAAARVAQVQQRIQALQAEWALRQTLAQTAPARAAAEAAARRAAHPPTPATPVLGSPAAGPPTAAVPSAERGGLTR